MANISESVTLNDRNVSSVFSVHPRANYTLYKEVSYWLSNEKTHRETPNMTVLPVLALICFIVLVCLKFYKWHKDGLKQKTRGDVEFGDESEVNYGIIKAGDKEFCNVEIRSDTTSVYDTVSSFRHIGNGHALGTGVGAGAGNYNYHDTVTSYRSLLMQRSDCAQYDSVKSYTAFLKQVTQKTDLAVEVKLLENYPVLSKSAEHCVLEEESSGITSEAMRPLPFEDVKVTVECKKKPRHRRASGDNIGAMRKRSASNPTYHSSRTGAASLPSIRGTMSSDSSNEEDVLVTLPSDRRKLWEIRKKMARSCSGGKLAKGSQPQNEEGSLSVPHPQTRRRHYSADGAWRPRKNYVSLLRRADLKELRESMSETDPKPEEVVPLQMQDDSSSENPDSSPTSCNTSVSSDAIESESEDDDTQQITQVSAASDEHTLMYDAVFDSCGDLTSSAEHLLEPVTDTNEPMNGTCNIMMGQNGEVRIPVPVSPVPSSPSSISKSKTSYSDNEKASPHKSASSSTPAANGHGNYSVFLGSNELGIIQADAQDLSSSSNIMDSNYSVSDNLLPSPKASLSAKGVDEPKNEITDSPGTAHPRHVKRFHVTFVSSDMSSPNSD